MTQLQGIPESLLIPLAARSYETEKAHAIIKDPISQRIMAKLDYDFDKFSASWITQVGISVRTWLIDQLVRRFIEQAKQPLIINIGCGLDTRRQRLNLEDIPWIDLDVPDVILLRKQFFQETELNRFIAKSLLDETWMDDVRTWPPYTENSDILIIIEGVMMYFEHSEVQQFFNFVSQKLNAHQLQMIVECCSQLMAEHTHYHPTVSRLDSRPRFKYGYNRLSDFVKILPRTLRVTSEHSLFDYHSRRWKWFGLCRWIPFLKKRMNNKIVIIEQRESGI
ncbi:class I SAM-dependent methyltransferase [Staphylococcus argensis]|nr:class I SAM-dependent methyltransferase [Staphylococcus argensis]MCY6990239.1 class I SAM-dependent methyltransferase [Staphylococcus argensis]